MNKVITEDPLGLVPSGIHIYGDLFECQNVELLSNAVDAQKFILNEISKCFKPLHSHFHVFDPIEEQQSGYTGFVVLAESHFSIHTWNMERKANIDLYTCSFTKDNTENTKLLYQIIKDFYNPKKSITKSSSRY